VPDEGATKLVLADGLVVQRTDIGDWSLVVGCQVPTRPYGPLAPTDLAIVAGLERASLTWIAPTKNTRGEALKQGELAGFNVYWIGAVVWDAVTTYEVGELVRHGAATYRCTAESLNNEPPNASYWEVYAGIDISDPSTYTRCEFVDAERFEFTIPDPGTTYGPYCFRVTALNSDAMESVATSEVNATGVEVSGDVATSVDDWGTGNAEQVIVGLGRIFLRFRQQKSTWQGFSYYIVYFDVDDGTGFTGVWTELGRDQIGWMHAHLDATHSYKYKVSVLGWDGTETAGTTHDNGGAGYEPSEDDQANILADTVAAEHIIATYDIISRTLIGGTLQSPDWAAAAGSQFRMQRVAGTDSPLLRMGGDDVGYKDGTGIWMGYDDSASEWRLFFGDTESSPQQYLAFDGSGLTIYGDFFCSQDLEFVGVVSKHISFAVPSPGNALDDMETNSGNNYTGATERSYRVQIDGTGSPNTFKWSNDRGLSWEATTVNITGAAQALEDGITVDFGALTGHALNNYWDFTAGDTTVNIHDIIGVYRLFASTEKPDDGTRIILDGYGLGGGIDLYSGESLGSHVNLHAAGSVLIEALGGA